MMTSPLVQVVSYALEGGGGPFPQPEYRGPYGAQDREED